MHHLKPILLLLLFTLNLTANTIDSKEEIINAKKSPTSTTQYSYHNTLGRLTKEIQPSGAILEYAYDSVGNFSSFPSVLGGNA